MTRVLLLGGTGQLGHCLRDRCPPDWDLLAPPSNRLDVRDGAAVADAVSRERPALVINATAYNKVDQAESDADTAYAVNAAGPRHLAEAAARGGARLVHVSTDYVFDGTGHAPYAEDDPTNPLGAYGKSKRKGETAVLGAMPDALVIRTSWVYSEYGANFVKTMLRLAHEGRPLRVVDDQIGSPTYAGDLADAIVGLCGHPDAAGGIYHYSGATVMSWYEFAQRIVSLAQTGQLSIPVPVPSSDYPTVAPRPAYSVLSCEKIRRYGVEPRPIDASLARVVGLIEARGGAAG